MADTSTIQTNVLKALRLPSDDTMFQSRALRWMNKTLDKIQARFPDASFLETAEMTLTLVTSQPGYALPNDFITFTSHQLRNDDESIIINLIDRAEFDRRHPTPSDEDDAPTCDGTIEFDREDSRYFLRLCPAPDAADTLYAIMKRWHPSLTSGQNPQWDKLETVIEDGAIYEGSKEIYPDPEYLTLRQTYKMDREESFGDLGRLLAKQKPHGPQIQTILKKSDY